MSSGSLKACIFVQLHSSDNVIFSNVKRPLGQCCLMRTGFVNNWLRMAAANSKPVLNWKHQGQKFHVASSKWSVLSKLGTDLVQLQKPHYILAWHVTASGTAAFPCGGWYKKLPNSNFTQAATKNFAFLGSEILTKTWGSVLEHKISLKPKFCLLRVFTYKLALVSWCY